MKRKRIRWMILGGVAIAAAFVVLLAPLLAAASALAVGVASAGSNAQQPTDKPETMVGNGDIVEVAKAQLGNKGGETYWRWYGFNSWADWCACFVSWCADQCGYIDTGVLPKFASVNDAKNGIAWWQTRGLWAGRAYTPSPGDIMFVDWDKDGSADHVEMVTGVNGTTIYTIGGNRDGGKGACSTGAFKKGSWTIYGYGTPKYNTLLWPAPDWKYAKKSGQSLAICPATETTDVTGVSIIAAKTGTVTRISPYTDKTYWSIEISHGKGEMVTVYDRCATPKVKQGDTVKAGQIIATMARPMPQTAISFWFTVRVDGKIVDPIQNGYLSTDGVHLS